MSGQKMSCLDQQKWALRMSSCVWMRFSKWSYLLVRVDRVLSLSNSILLELFGALIRLVVCIGNVIESCFNYFLLNNFTSKRWSKIWDSFEIWVIFIVFLHYAFVYSYLTGGELGSSLSINYGYFQYYVYLHQTQMSFFVYEAIKALAWFFTVENNPIAEKLLFPMFLPNLGFDGIIVQMKFSWWWNMPWRCLVQKLKGPACNRWTC